MIPLKTITTEPNRLGMVDLLMQGLQCNCELGDALGMAPILIPPKWDG